MAIFAPSLDVASGIFDYTQTALVKTGSTGLIVIITQLLYQRKPLYV
ncbi:MAG: hypothetical protein WEA36_06585 [Balneolaceae bacterium]